ncbi:hypothetical protein GCM10025867_25490 [Frondihabitans sucicola]|uniref:TM0106 family RecB-like nuclease n=1 Tax=Frondihabitans sucicola TaxID=1268041 RepID=A0ABN6XZC5_9MICO|nr:bifunctional RecB family nuclease/DEAD/DEAH box helicase [Frondihabitans sucicola]BDZ50308.1 hypothetical protein GCM10025867_25490 [Frondihabitans sucicola]
MYVDAEGDHVVTSPSDLSTWAACEWAFLRRLDAKLGRIERAKDVPDAMLDRTAALGIAHEVRYLNQLRERYGTANILEFADRPAPAEYATAAAAARDAMLARVPVLYQATFFDGWFLGFSDFLILNDAGDYEVYDTKLARHAKIPALLQLAGYAEQIAALGIPVGDRVHLVLGDNTVSSHALSDLLPVYRVQLARLRAVLADRLLAPSPVPWGDPRFLACGRCTACTEQVEAHRDLVLVAGMRLEQRAKLQEAQITTIDELASSAGPVAGLSSSTLAKLRAQARVQVGSGELPLVEVVDREALFAIPAPDAGDIFFDFEGDPLYTEGDPAPGEKREWGLDYLFGLVESDSTFVAFWAHDFAEERVALRDFLAYLAARRAAYPDMHVYHYAAYERTHLLSLAARHALGEEQVDDLLRDHVLVDLYPIVRNALIIGSHSYSLKKLEPLYMGSVARESDVKTAAASIDAYVEAITELRNGDPAEGQRQLDQVAEYNEYDCLSTLRLRDWLLALLPPSSRERPEPPVPEELVLNEPDPVSVEMSALVAGLDPAERTSEQTALALGAAAIDYHRRENKSFWQEHFDRLTAPLDEWADTRGVFVVESGEVLRDWSKLPKARTWSREVRLYGQLAPGSRLRVSKNAGPFALYEPPAPAAARQLNRFSRSAVAVTLVEVDDLGESLVIRERVGDEADASSELPVALTPPPPPFAKPQPEAISEWGRGIIDVRPTIKPDAAFDLLRREPPRGGVMPVEGTDTIGAVVTTLLGLDRSYLAVQGPPGTGKTYVGSHVIARLVTDHGWKVGVVGQSHAVVENVLDAVIATGVPASRVGKVPAADASPDDTAVVEWTVMKNDQIRGFLSEPGGRVIGGTAWLFANADRIDRLGLDLLVIDEAGQFSLASTIASSVAASRLLLLGDPQQLPQVSQGIHPEPVDESALGWLAAGHDVLPAEFGYFLSRTWRMHPALTQPVSRLSYAGALESQAASRTLTDVEPGLHPVPVVHTGNTTSSVLEAERVVALAVSMIGRQWTDENGSRPLTDDDVIVVAPYNAQADLIRAGLDDAGLTGTTVGTVDKFQGREAVVAIVSLAASSGADIPRGLDFLLMPNRLNVALSRAKWAAYLVYSPALVTGMPTSVAGLGLLSGFIGLVGADGFESAGDAGVAVM